ncbi:glutamate decarboxylase protein [Rutstroemia sp. NJR-2017a WRK4]|nr:glutamate decarboxylase protein [Rutstroemia sp. NJR-2017a WRK4]
MAVLAWSLHCSSETHLPGNRNYLPSFTNTFLPIMPLARHVDPDDIVHQLHDLHMKDAGRRHVHSNGGTSHITPYSTRYAAKQEISKFKIPHDGAPADAVHQLLKDELDLDGRPNLNLASFVGTYMESHAEQLMFENISKNMSDADEYPAMMQMHARCVSIIANLWGVQKGEKAIGSATTGSSEAIHLGGLAMKRRWQEKRMKDGKDTSKPNIIMGANAQVALEKFARYFEVEARILPVSKKSNYRLDPDLVKENIDENTIGVFVILGSTYTGHYEPVEEISKILDDFEAKTGVDIPIHVDAASGGFVAPFTHAQAGGPKWNFELPRVKSINTSGHKFGLVYAGVGWIIWRDESYLPKHLVFELHYLGGTEESYTLNFSRPGAQIIAQYYNLIHLGFTGYRQIMENCMANARLLSKSLEATGWYICVSDIHRKKGEHEFKGANQIEFGSKDETSADYNAGLPVVAFRFSDEFKKEFPHIKQESISNLLRAKQYIIPNYPLPPNEEKYEILRVVVRESMSFDLLDRLIADICATTQQLIESDAQDLTILNHSKDNSVEKQHASSGGKHKEGQGKGGKRPMTEGVHRSVC